jgi:hypothetical protein
VALVLAAGLGPAGACRAGGLVISAPDLTVTAGSSGSFDVLLTNTNAANGASYDVAVDSFQLSLSGPLDATFTGVSISTVAAPYIYVTSGTTMPGGGPLSSDSFPTTAFTASDSEFASPGFRTVSPGDVFGLAHVSYSVGATTSGGVDAIAFPVVSLTELDGTVIPVTTSNGSITVLSIPEPSTLIQAGSAVLIGLGAVWRRRSR